MSEDFGVDLTATRDFMRVLGGLGASAGLILVAAVVAILCPAVTRQFSVVDLFIGIDGFMLAFGVGFWLAGGPPLRLVVGDGRLSLKHQKTGATLAEAPISELWVQAVVVEGWGENSMDQPGLQIRFPNRKRLVVMSSPRFSSKDSYERVSTSTHEVGQSAFIALVDALEPGAWLPEV